MNRRSFLAVTASTAAFFALAGRSAFASDPIFTGLVPGVAVAGYDTVAYFTKGMETKGDEAFKTTYMDVEWRFSSQENLDMFVANPEKYAPQYGGYCAFAASKGYLAKGDPEAWTVYEGKLYLNFNKDVRTLWKQDIPGNIEKANANFPGLIGKS